MSSIILMLKRELMVLSHNWLKDLLFFIMFPMIMFLCISMPLYEVITVPILNYLHWSIPGILLLTSSIVCANHCIRKVFLLKDKSQYYQVFIKSPMSIGNIVGSIYIISILYGVIEFIIGAVILSLINPGVFSLMQCFFIFIQVVSFLFFIGSISLLLGFLISNEDMIVYVIIIFFLIIAFAFGSLLPIELFPIELSAYLKVIPMVTIIMNTQQILYMELPLYFGMFMSIVIGVIFYLIAIVFAYKTLRIQS